MKNFFRFSVTTIGVVADGVSVYQAGKNVNTMAGIYWLLLAGFIFLILVIAWIFFFVSDKLKALDKGSDAYAKAQYAITEMNNIMIHRKLDYLYNSMNQNKLPLPPQPQDWLSKYERTLLEREMNENSKQFKKVVDDFNKGLNAP